MKRLGRDHQLILGILNTKGVASSQELQDATGKSQPSVSRLLADLSARVLTLGRARATRYGLPKLIRGLSAQQPIWWTSEDGDVREIGTLSLLADDVVHVDSELVASTTRNELPWYLTPLQAQGFLGRLLAQRLSASGIGPNPEDWSVEISLFAALHLHDAPGAISIGIPSPLHRHSKVPTDPTRMAAAFDDLASDVARTLPAGSSAGGEQPKFLALLDSGRHVLVKFSPPRGTPFGERWHDLLHAEALASQVLAQYGVPVASASVIESPTRTYLVSERFDRIGKHGRRHVVSVGAAHKGFVADAYSNWGATCHALARQRRLSPEDAARAAALLNFGRLTGNTDMHSGNLGLIARPEDLARGRFTLAPVYDMLPMRWRPDASMGGAPDYTPFEADTMSLSSAAASPARDFWERLSRSSKVSKGLRRVAGEMASRINGASAPRRT